MEDELSAARIANAICQDASFDGVYLLVEGKRDVQLYRRFLSGKDVRVRATWGKYRQREVYELLAERKMFNALGIRDADFLRIKGNEKYISSYSTPIFPTDFHDAEIMIACSGALDDYVNHISDEERILAFEEKVGHPLRQLLLSLIFPLGCLRLANKRYGLGLSFKPEKVDGNRLKFHKFVSENDWMLDQLKMINTVWEYSQNRGKAVASREEIASRLSEVISEGHPVEEVVNGHDLAATLFLVSTLGLRSKNKLLQDPGCVEQLLIALYDIKKFSSTSLYSSVSAWSRTTGRPQVFSAPA